MKIRPNLKMPLNTYEKTLQVFSFVTVNAAAFLTIMKYSSLPDVIESGDGIQKKGIILVIMGIMIFIYALLSVLERYPNIYNYLVKITSENMRMQYHNARMLLTVVKTGMCFIYLLLIMDMINQGKGVQMTMLPMAIVLLFVAVFTHIYRMIRLK